MKPLDRVLLLITALLASYQVVQGIDGLNNMAIACYTIAFGVIVIASLLMIILGFGSARFPGGSDRFIIDPIKPRFRVGCPIPAGDF